VTHPRPITVLLADDNGVVLAVLRDTLNGRGTGIAVVGEAHNGIEALELAGTLRPDVALLDHRMPLRDGLSVVAGVAVFSRVLMLTRTMDDDIVLAAIRAGALGYLVHGQFSPVELVRGIHAVAAGQAHLSPTAARVLVNNLRAGGDHAASRAGAPLSSRQREIMDLIAAGRPNADIAVALALTEKTVRNQVSRIYDTLRVRNRAEAIRRWLGQT
jgi:DNA-binding NarL/FixJ family response regulator